MAKQTIFLGTVTNDDTGDPFKTCMDKTNDNFDELYGVVSGDLAGSEVTFDTRERHYTKTVSASVEMSMAASGNVANSFIIITVTGNGTALLTFPATWIMKGDTYDPSKVQEVGLRYTGAYVIGYITIIEDI